MGPSAEDFFQGRPSLETWHSSARPDPTSYRSDYHSSAGTSGDSEPTGGWQAHAFIWQEVKWLFSVNLLD